MTRISSTAYPENRQTAIPALRGSTEAGIRGYPDLKTRVLTTRRRGLFIYPYAYSKSS